MEIMKRKNKGFTLIEILASIAILMLILLLVTPKVKTTIRESKDKAYANIVTTIEEAAKTYTYKNTGAIDSVIETNGFAMVSLDTLQKNGLLATDITNPYTNEILSSNKGVRITKNGDLYIFEYMNEDSSLVTLAVVLNNGNTTQEFEESYFPGEMLQLINPTKAGSIFDGWVVTGTNTVLSGSILSIGLDSTTITATWQMSAYRVSYDANGGTVNPTYKDMSYFDTVYGTLTTPTKSGYLFKGWYTQAEGGTEVTSTTTITNFTGHTLYAHWEIKPYTINYNCNGGSGSTQASSNLIYGETFNLSTNGCYKTATSGSSGKVYYFKGWGTSNSSTNPTYTDEQSITTGFSGNTTLYAVYGELFNVTGSYEVVNDNSVCTGCWRLRIKGASGSTYGIATITFNIPTAIDAFLVGGGGGGGNWTGGVSAGGGGGGAYSQVLSNISVSATAYDVIIGNGGAAGIASSTSDSNTIGKNLGSVGIGTTAFNTTVNGGNGGGNGNVDNWYVGGTGGAAGGNTSENGAAGTYEFADSSTGTLYAAGGGGGATYYGGIFYAPGTGGSNIGGNGAIGYGNATAAIANTGSGGGGAHGGLAGAGGSGIVVIRNHRS